jgi:hypothetical protein
MGRSRQYSANEDLEMVEPTATSPLRRTRYGYSHESIGRYSEHSLHYPYRIQDTKTCGKWLKKVGLVVMTKQNEEVNERNNFIKPHISVYTYKQDVGRVTLTLVRLISSEYLKRLLFEQK